MDQGTDQTRNTGRVVQAHLSLDEAMGMAMDRHRAGRLAEAESLYRQILARVPVHASALQLLGALCQQTGRHAVAIDLIDQALALSPGSASPWSNRGLALNALGRFEEAAASFRNAIVLQPDFAVALCNFGVVLAVLGQVEAAATSFRHALALNPDFDDAAQGLAGTLQHLGRLAEAAAVYRDRLARQPHQPEVLNSLAGVLLTQGRWPEAEAVYRQALALRPDYIDAINNMASAVQAQERLDEAIDLFRHALVLQPDQADVWSNLGGALQTQCRLIEAVAAYRRALAARPVLAKARSNMLINLNYFDDLPAGALYDEHRAFEEHHARPLARLIQPHANHPDPGRRLKVGYVSADLWRHSCAFFIAPVLATHDRGAVEVFCYAEVRKPDSVTGQLKTLADHWRHTVGMSDDALAERIRADGIDILVDLTGHFAEHRLLVFARKPAPVQVTWLGYPNTTGLSAIDYRFTDPIADPPGAADAVHSESLVRLPHGFHCFAPPHDAPAITPLPALASGSVTFGSFNNLNKLTARGAAVWAAILHGVPGARLLLKGRQLGDPTTRQWCLDLFARNGIGAERLDLVAWVPVTHDHLSLYRDIDIGLDPFPYNGTTTTCEALWMGVPVITLRGDRHAGRVGASLLTRVGLTELIADSPAAYVEIATRLAADRARLAALRASLRPRVQQSRLCDRFGFTREVEAAYRAMWQRWCARAS